MKKLIRDFFGFSSTEINGFLILLPLMILLMFSEPLYRKWMTRSIPDKDDAARLDSLIATWGPINKESTKHHRGEDPNNAELFDFDPNKISVDDLVRLGFSRILAKRIASYRQKGGVFRIRVDLKKIYGVDSMLYRRLYSHILLPEKSANTSTKRDSVIIKRNNLFVLDVNTADSAQWEALKGIGPTLASRILKYRAKLGGFVRIGQLKEIYGLDSLVLNSFADRVMIAEDFVPKKIDVNTSTERELSQHPYIKAAMARAIVSYRFQHGSFVSVEDLLRLPQLKNTDIEKLRPYITITH